MTKLEVFADRAALADGATAVIAAALAAAGAGAFVASGGSTPGPVYDRLAGAQIDWSRITVTLGDERFVDPASADSNERLVRSRLLKERAAAARFTPLKGAGPTPEDDARAAEPAIRALLPAACTLIGMGGDGHFGSLFPGSPDLTRNLDPDGARLVVGVAMSPDKPFTPRISLTLAAFLAARTIVVLISGADKRAIVDRILEDPAYAPPIASVLRQHRTPVRLLWAA